MANQKKLREKIIARLKEVLDPELGISVYDLGLIYEIDIKEGAVKIKMGLTAPGCPFMDFLKNEVKQAAWEAGASQVTVEMVDEPAWRPEMMTEEGKKKLKYE